MALAALLDELTFGSVARREEPVASHIPYSRHVDDQTLKTRDGLYLSVLKLDGFCFETADMAEINARLATRNILLRGLGTSRFAVMTHVIRRAITPKLPGPITNPFAAELDRRYAAQLGARRLFVNDTYLTIIRRPLQGRAGQAEHALRALFGARGSAAVAINEEEELRALHDAVANIVEILQPYGAKLLTVVRRGDGWYSEPLEFLIQLLNGAQARPMSLPRMALNQALASRRLFFGRATIGIQGATKADSRFAAMLSVAEYPSYTGPGLTDGLLKAPHELIVTQSFAIVDRPAAQGQIERVGRQVEMSDEAGSIVAEHLEEARNELLASEAIYGLHHMSVMCFGQDAVELDRAVTTIEALLTDLSMIHVREDLNAEAAFWAQLPGNLGYIARGSLISSKNFAGFASLHNYPSGTPAGNHWGPAIAILETSSQTAYHFNFHQRDLGNFTVVGPSGSGKTVALSFLMAQALRLKPEPVCVFFDKDRGAEIFIRALGGRYETLQPGEPTGFNPLALADGGDTRAFLFQLFAFLLRPNDQLNLGAGGLSAGEEQVIRNAIALTLDAGPEARTLDAFATLLRGRLKAGDADLLARLEPWRRPDQRGWLFNNGEDRFSWSQGTDNPAKARARIYGFDMTRVLDDPAIRTAALLYIFHRIDELMTGAPVMIFLDEGWRLLDDPVFALFIKDKLKTIRKQNGIVGFGTQSAADIVRSSSANTLIEQSATNIFFPNPKADDASYGEAFRLSQREIAWIRETGPELRSFLIRHGRDSVIAKLNLSGMPDLIKVLSGRTESVAELDRLRAELGDDPAGWLPIFCGWEARHAEPAA
ncbi:MAG: VirB4 family type IV secretion/conjugal transfer ATPase [Aestuariivirga sp.]